MKQNHLLIAGCPRSGTSALGHLIGKHPHAVIGHERFKHLARNNIEAYSPHLYRKERFFDFRRGDTNQTPELTKNNRRTYQEAFAKFDTATIFGDKTPHYYTRYRELVSLLPEAKFVFIFRDVNDVCSSFNRNCDDPNKSWSQDFTHAVANWNESLQTTRAILETHAKQFFVIEYEKFYSGNDQIAKNLFSFLSLSYALVQEAYENACNKYHEQVKVKGALEREGQQVYIQKHADWKCYQHLQSAAA